MASKFDWQVWKWTLEPGVNVLRMPRDHGVIHVGAQHGAVRIWARVRTSSPMRPHKFAVVGTGRTAPPEDGGNYHVGVAQIPAGEYELVWHVFSFGQVEEDEAEALDPAGEEAA